MVDGVGTTTYSYDASAFAPSSGATGRRQRSTVTYTYANELRRSVSVSAPNASPWTETYGYDAAKRLTNGTSQAGSFGYLYGAPNSDSALVRKLTLPNGAYITNEYDSVARQLS